VFNNITKEKKSMKKRNRLISALLTATMLVGCLTMVGCGSQSGDSATGTQAEGASSMTSVTIGALYDPETMTPWSARNLGRIATCFNVYETMAEKADNDDGIVGILAKEWEKTDDYTYSVTLLYRKVLTFRNHDMRNARTEAGMVSDEGDQKR
jgi:ABC-type transport system substrate-binding protein